MDTDNDYYEILGVPPSADPKAIRAAYRMLALKHHPDRAGGDPGAVARMALINEAYRILGDSQRREQYDRARAPKPRETQPRPAPDPQPATVWKPERYRPEVRTTKRGRRPTRGEQAATQVAGCLMAILVALGVVMLVGLLFVGMPDLHDESLGPSEQIDDAVVSPGSDWELPPLGVSDGSGDEHLDSYSQQSQESLWDRWDSGQTWDSQDADDWDSWNDEDPEPILP